MTESKGENCHTMGHWSRRELDSQKGDDKLTSMKQKEGTK